MFFEGMPLFNGRNDNEKSPTFTLSVYIYGIEYQINFNCLVSCSYMCHLVNKYPNPGRSFLVLDCMAPYS